MIKLRPGQIDVASYRNGYMAVPAVPGAGKTTVLAYLAADLIEGGYTGKGKILIVTYMNSAVANFRSKIGDFLEERGLPRNRGYVVRTLHSLALNILKEKPEYLLINDEFNIIDPSRRGRLIQDLIAEWLREKNRVFLKFFDYLPESPGYRNALKRWKEADFPGLIKAMISQFKLYGLNFEEASKLRRYCRQDSYLDWALAIYQNYDRALNYQGLLDFDDLVRQSLNLLEKDQLLLERLQEKYTYVFEDEAQDSNLLLARILSLLAGEDGNLLRVGDSNQAIMGTFTNADPGIFRDYSARKEVERCSILYSSRSTKEIIDLANYLVKWSLTEHPQEECRDALEEKYIYPVLETDPFPNPVTSTYTIATNLYKTSKEELENVAYLAARHIKDNPENTAAILVPANYIIEGIVEELEKLGVRYESPGLQESRVLKTIQDSKMILTYLAEPVQKENLMAVLNELLLKEYLADGEYSDSINELFNRYTIEEIIYPIGGDIVFQEYIRGIIPHELETPFTDAIEKIRLWLDASVKLPPDELILFIAEQLKLKEEELAVAQNIAIQIRSELDLNPHWKLHELVAELPRLETSFNQFASKIYERKGYEPESGVITVTTFHKSKGLEWDTVYISYLTDDNFPSTINDRFRSDYYYLKDEYSNPVAIAKASLKKLLLNREAIGDTGIVEEEIDKERMEKNSLESEDLLEKRKEAKPVKVVEETGPRKEANIEFIKERLRLLYVAITRGKKNLLLSAHQEVIYDNGRSKKVAPASPFIALANFINKEREVYGERS